jgi:integrase
MWHAEHCEYFRIRAIAVTIITSTGSRSTESESVSFSQARRKPKRNLAPEIFTPEQLAQLLNAAPAELLPAPAIQAFAGLRTAELLRLEWREVDQTRGFITVSAKKAKTAKRRLIPLASNLAEWLRPYAGKTGLLWGKGFRSYHVALRNLATEIGFAHWPNNGLRHSFASYHLAKYQNAPQLALEMGHSTPRMVFDNYREVVAPAEAERYWIIRPNVIADNIVRLSTAT